MAMPMTVQRRNLQGFLIGSVGAALTLLSYYQTLVTDTQCLLLGFLLLLLGLLVKEGIVRI